MTNEEILSDKNKLEELIDDIMKGDPEALTKLVFGENIFLNIRNKVNGPIE